MTLNYIHYAFLAAVMIAAFAFAFIGKMDVTAAFGIAGAITGVAIPTSVKAPETPSITPPPAP